MINVKQQVYCFCAELLPELEFREDSTNIGMFRKQRLLRKLLKCKDLFQVMHILIALLKNRVNVL